MQLKALSLILLLNKYSDVYAKQPLSLKTKSALSNEINYNELDEHALVTNGRLFPYMVAILLKSTFLSAGALIDENWALTAADSLYLLREATRSLRIRLGSINYKKGGLLLPVKYVVIHPQFDDDKPSYDLAMIRLPESITYTPEIQPIKLQNKQVDASHFIVPSWPNPMDKSNINVLTPKSQASSEESEQLKSMELIKRRRLLSVTHLHLSDDEDCEEGLLSIGVKNIETMICLDSAVMNDPCSRDVGAPVVVNGKILGVVSSWKPRNCNSYAPGSTFVTLVSPSTVSSWIHATISGHKWEKLH